MLSHPQRGNNASSHLLQMQTVMMTAMTIVMTTMPPTTYATIRNTISAQQLSPDVIIIITIITINVFKNNININICTAHIVDNQTESEAPAVARWAAILKNLFEKVLFRRYLKVR